MNHHIIYKQKATIQVAKEAQARAVQNEISDVMKHELPQLLQAVFDSIHPGNDIIRIDSVHLDLGTLPEQNTGQVFKERVAEKIREAIVVSKNNSTSEAGVKTVRKAQSLREALLYFLQTGTKPWFMRAGSRKEWESEMQQAFAQDDWQNIVLWLQQNHHRQPIITERLVRQFSNDFIDRIITLMLSFDNGKQEDIYRELLHLYKSKNSSLANAGINTENRNTNKDDSDKDEEQNSSAYDNIITKKRNTNTSGSNADEEQNHLSESIMASEKTVAGKKAQSPRSRTLLHESIEDEPQYVNNCGIVLLHPFLEMYFAEFALLSNRNFINDKACQRAVLLLHYLATGETEGEEWNLQLQKLMCGLSSEETLPDRIDITDTEKEETEKLLQSVISYCPPLKNTSVAGLRSTFLQRDGRLEKKENGWLLTVEQKTVDILLDKLPWGFSTIRLPWLAEIINVDWC